MVFSINLNYNTGKTYIIIISLVNKNEYYAMYISALTCILVNKKK